MPTQQAKKFLAAAIPWEGDYSDIIFTTTSLNPKTNKPFINGRAYPNFTKILNGLDWLEKNPDTRDIYVCMSSQRDATTKTSQKGFKYEEAIRSSTNTVSLKSFFIDIDVATDKKPKGYSDTVAALEALGRFYRSVDLPKPSAIVASGSGGFHVHWILDEAIKRDVWVPLAHALAAAIRDRGLICDTQCTVDCARILRVPDTKNWKTGTPTPVTLLHPREGQEVDTYSLGRIEKALAPFVGLTRAPSLPEQSLLPRKAAVIDDELGAGISDGPQPNLDAVAEYCGFVANTIATGGRDNDNPLWYLTGNLATFSEGGEADFLRMSSGHKDFDPVDAKNTFERIQQGKNGAGWASCAKIHMAGAKECDSCPLLSKGKSPLNFGMPKNGEILTNTPGQLVANPTPFGLLPYRFHHGPDGSVRQNVMQDDGTNMEIELCEYPMMNGWVERGTHTLNFTTKIGNRITPCTMPINAAMSKQQFPTALATLGLAINEFKVKGVREFMTSWIRTLQANQASTASPIAFGWIHKPDSDALEGFAYGGRVWCAGNSDKPSALPDPVISGIYSPTGSLEVWKAAARMVTDQGTPALDTYIASSFAAPLIALMEVEGILLSGYSVGSGVGKSTALSVANAVWGDPILAKQMLDDTAASTTQKLGAISSLPLYWDELRTLDDIDGFMKLIFRLSYGKDKSRANANMTMKKTSVWQTMMVSAANRSVVDAMLDQGKIDGDSSLYRLFEFEMFKSLRPSTVTTPEMSRAIGRLRRNYGQAGLIYAKFLGSHHEKIRKEVTDTHDLLSAKLKSTQAERYWMVTIAAVLCGAQYANRLGLIKLDEAGIMKHMIDTLNHMRGLISGDVVYSSSDQHQILQLVSDFIAENGMRYGITTDTINVNKPGKPLYVKINLISGPERVDKLYVHKIKHDNIILIRASTFNQWLRDRKLPERSTIRNMLAIKGITKSKRTMGYGTLFAQGQDYTYEFDLNSPMLSDFSIA